MSILVKFIICFMVLIFAASKLLRKGSIVIKAHWLEKYYENQILIEGASLAAAIIFAAIYLIFW